MNQRSLRESVDIRLPRGLVLAVLLVSIAPFALNLIGFDFASQQVAFEPHTAAEHLTEHRFHSFAGAFTHTILEWSALMLAVFVCLLAFTNYAVANDSVAPVLGVALLCSGVMDGFHTLAATRLISATAANTDLIPFTWALCRLFNSLILIAGFLLLMGFRERTHRHGWFVVVVSAAFVSFAYLVIHWCAQSEQLPKTQFPDELISRPWDVLPLVTFVVLGFLIYRFIQRENSLFARGILLSIVPNIAVQLHMALRSSTLFDNDFNVAHFLKIVAYAVPLAALCVHYVRLYAEREKENRLALNVSERKLRFLFESAPVGFALSGMEGRYLSSNFALQQMLGYSAEEFKELAPSEVCVSDSVEFSDSPLEEKTFESELIRKDGTRVAVHVNRLLLKEQDNRRYCWDIIEDYSLKKAQERALQAARDKALEASQSKSEFLANMSHEIRTPMNGVLGMLSLLLDTSLDPEQFDLADTAHRSATSLLSIINDILDYSKVEAGKVLLSPHDFSLKDMLSEVEALHRGTATEKSLSLVFKLEDGLSPHFRADAFRIKQVLHNLLGNAIKFTPEGGAVLVQVTQAEQRGQEVVLRFGVTDSGAGIPEEYHPKIFEAFSQADSSTTRNFGGTGLGLSISARLVRLMGGEIGLQSLPGVGSSFFFTTVVEELSERDESDLLLADEEEKAPLELHCLVVEDNEEKAPLELHCLVVEDNKVNQKLALKLLEKDGHKVTLANNGKEALEVFEKQDFDVILMDIQMPVMGGEEATACIRQTERGRKVPIIALTANAMSGDKERFLSAGMNDYVSKPIRRELLYSAIANSVHTPGSD